MKGSSLSVLVATRDRASDLQVMLESLAPECPDVDEVIVVDNGSQDSTPDVLARFAQREPKLRVLAVAAPGQSRALNHAIRASTGACLAFLDDDIRVEPGWARALIEAFRTLRHAGIQGRIRLPAEDRDDPERKARYELYRTFPVIDYGAEPGERRTLTGANMAIRRSVLDELGLFDERLGPGAAGLSGDTELAGRISRRYGPFAYVPGAAVSHIYDASRLTDAYHEQYHRRMGRSRWIQKRPELYLRILPDLTAAWIKTKFARLGGRKRAYYRQVGRYYVYSEMLRLAREKDAVAGGATTVRART